MNTFEKCIEIACKAHFGQKDKNGEDYIFHPFIVAHNAKEFSDDAKCVGMLHDVLEDSEITVEQLLNEHQIPKNIVDAVVILTKQKWERYDRYINRVVRSNNLVALRVKRDDLRHNLNPKRSDGISDQQKEKYKSALKLIEQKYFCLLSKRTVIEE